MDRGGDKNRMNKMTQYRGRSSGVIGDKSGLDDKGVTNIEHVIGHYFCCIFGPFLTQLHFTFLTPTFLDYAYLCYVLSFMPLHS